MKLELISKSRYKDNEMEIAIWFNNDEKFSPKLGYMERFRLIFVQRGDGVLDLNGCRFAFFAPAVIYINEQDHIKLEAAKNMSAKSIYFHPCVINFSFNYENMRDASHEFNQTERFELAWLQPFWANNIKTGRIVSVGPSSYSRISQLFVNIEKELGAQDNRFWACRTRSYVLELLIFLMQLPKSSDTLELTENYEDINSVILYINNNYPNKITLPELAREFNTNRTTLSERFYSATGISIGTYLVRRRMEVAAVLIRDTNLPVMEIFHRVGFNNISHFITAFRKHYKISPKEYRSEFTCMR